MIETSIRSEFPKSELTFTRSGIYSIYIRNDEKTDMIKAYKMIKHDSQDIGPSINKINQFIKEVSISQSNLENIFIEVKLTLIFSYVIYIRIKLNFFIIIFFR